MAPRHHSGGIRYRRHRSTRQALLLKPQQKFGVVRISPGPALESASLPGRCFRQQGLLLELIEADDSGQFRRQLERRGDVDRATLRLALVVGLQLVPPIIAAGIINAGEHCPCF
ncbi:MAG: hypothetical protein HND55_08855 [Pseudomonadota bacterium]|nr:MAG: hypothetical protein HND55_08855 [Pseudomonadota bacterium]